MITAVNTHEEKPTQLKPVDENHWRTSRLEYPMLYRRIISFDWVDEDVNDVPAFKSGQIGFRQMRHTLEASYGGLKVQSVKLPTDK